MDLKRVPIIGSILFLSACLAEAEIRDIDQNADPINQSCQEFGGSEEVCSCVSRESHTRFSDPELELISHLGDSSLSDRLASSELTPTEQTSLIQRVRNANIVIRQTCGSGLVSENSILEPD